MNFTANGTNMLSLETKHATLSGALIVKDYVNINSGTTNYALSVGGGTACTPTGTNSCVDVAEKYQ
jgi:hypothetical protein